MRYVHLQYEVLFPSLDDMSEDAMSENAGQCERSALTAEFASYHDGRGDAH